MGPQENASQTVNCIKKDYKQQSIQSFFFSVKHLLLNIKHLFVFSSLSLQDL